MGYSQHCQLVTQVKLLATFAAVNVITHSTHFTLIFAKAKYFYLCIYIYYIIFVIENVIIHKIYYKYKDEYICISINNYVIDISIIIYFYIFLK